MISILVIIAVENTSYCIPSKPIKTQVVNSRELLLPGFQQEIIQRDYPISDLVINNKHSVWILGQTALWDWNLIGNNLSKIQLLKKPGGHLKQLRRSQQEIFVASDKSLFYIKFNPAKTLIFKPKNETKKVKSFGIFTHDGGVFWIKSRDVWYLNIKNRNLEHWGFHPQIENDSKVFFDHLNKKLWVMEDQKLLFHDYEHPKSKFRQSLKVIDRFRGIEMLSRRITLFTQHTILLGDSNGKIIRSIPVEGSRRLVQGQIKANQHTYLFHDKFIQVYKPTEKTSYFSKLETGRVKVANALDAHRSFIALTLDGAPRIFQLEGKW